MVDVQINLWAVLVATVVHYVLGALWYSPLLFGKTWMTAPGKREAEIKQGGVVIAYLGSFICTLVMAYILAHFIAYANATNILLGATTGFWAWLGFVATTGAINSLFQSRTLKLFLIDAGYFLAGLLIMGAILGTWK